MPRNKPRPAIAFLLLAFTTAQPVLNSNVELPESLHRRAWLPFPQDHLMQRMLLEATLKHRSPITHACSSLEGPTCLYGYKAQPSVARDRLGMLARIISPVTSPRTAEQCYPTNFAAIESAVEGALDAVSRAAQRKVKVILMKPDGSKEMRLAIRKYLSKEESDKSKPFEAGSDTSEDADSSDDGKVVYEGTADGLADLEGLAQSVLRAGGLPQSAAALLQTQLARAITNVEFEKEEQQPEQHPKEADSGGAATSSGPNPYTRDESESHPGVDGRRADPSDSNSAGEAFPGGISREAIAAMSQDQLSTLFHSVLNGLRDAKERQPSKDKRSAEPSGKNTEYDHLQAQETQHYQQQQQQQQHTTRREQGTQQTRPFSAQYARRGSLRMDTRNPRDDSSERRGGPPHSVQTDDGGAMRESGGQPMQPGAEHEVWGDAQPGGTPVEVDGRADAVDLPRQLADDRAWLAGLTDAEYDAYWENYYNDVDREAEMQDSNDHGKAGNSGAGNK